jgi:glycosyltransferase involved in cell wall biosynthesis
MITAPVWRRVRGPRVTVGRVHVGLNLVYLVPGETGGMETYARELIPRLAELEGLRLTAFINREAAESGDGPWREIAHQTVPVRARNRAEWVRGEQQHLPRMALRAGCELVHSLATTSPLWGRFVRVTTIHDLNYKLAPEAHFGLLRFGMGVLVPASARRSHRIVVDASATVTELERHLRVPPTKIDVVPLGVSGRPLAEPTPAARLRQQLGLGERPIVLSVSAKRPHKNLVRLLEAHARFDEASRPVLVIPGYRTPHEQQLIDRASRLGTLGSVRFPGWLSEADLEGLYRAATAFVLPSLQEGFGLPVLEAMRRGLPVACSNRSTLPEVAGEAALLFDPEDPGAIERSLRRLLDDERLRRRLAAAGRARAARFSWEATATGTLAAYRRALAAGERSPEATLASS